MPPRDWKLRLGDILDAIDKIERYTAGMTRDAFAEDSKTIDAVVRNLIVIGEAAQHVPDEVAVGHAEIPWASMRGMRNIVVHEYFGVDVDILWETVQADLPPLGPRLRSVLGE